MNTRTANEGMWLTQANPAKDSERTFAKAVAGFADLDSLFTEWSDEQKAQWEQEHPIEPSDEISDTEALNIITGQI